MPQGIQAITYRNDLNLSPEDCSDSVDCEFSAVSRAGDFLWRNISIVCGVAMYDPKISLEHLRRTGCEIAENVDWGLSEVGEWPVHGSWIPPRRDRT
jgi:hypothetical protein